MIGYRLFVPTTLFAPGETFCTYEHGHRLERIRPRMALLSLVQAFAIRSFKLIFSTYSISIHRYTNVTQLYPSPNTIRFLYSHYTKNLSGLSTMADLSADTIVDIVFGVLNLMLTLAMILQAHHARQDRFRRWTQRLNLHVSSLIQHAGMSQAMTGTDTVRGRSTN